MHVRGGLLERVCALRFDCAVCAPSVLPCALCPVHGNGTGDRYSRQSCTSSRAHALGVERTQYLENCSIARQRRDPRNKTKRLMKSLCSRHVGLTLEK